ncbi:hypothetical protein I316_00622 [Kwoniella heveanensis BCC8398]|uniref:Uncharacterized protein n=1 Tax=Kwoniella heveanensis BCC8398 TaxID=1296120 RepID=A0A1B9H2K7_9TREE|nr:hypothetical protein I316_00622 [Kwoniella heveanensis BCC8398]
MESLSPECTPLKHRYDSCFNAWFEGYLQPALAASASASVSTSASSSENLASASGSTSQTGAPATLRTDSTPSSAPVKKTPIITSWAHAFPTRYRRKAKPSSDPNSTSSSSSSSSTNVGGLSAGTAEPEQEHHWYDFPFDDTPSEPEYETDLPLSGGTGPGGAGIEMDIKTRARIKAEEYQRNCGKVWEEYQGCLKKSIAQNESLSALLETAREEHPLGNLDGLKGTPWDSGAHFTSTE